MAELPVQVAAALSDLDRAILELRRLAGDEPSFAAADCPLSESHLTELDHHDLSLILDGTEGGNGGFLGWHCPFCGERASI